MDEQEFLDRFSKRILELAGSDKMPFGTNPITYAASVAAAYWSERHPEGLSPEKCAEEDADGWHE